MCYGINRISTVREGIKMNNKKEFKPYIPAEKIVPEMTVVAVVFGIFLAVVFGAANAYDRICFYSGGSTFHGIYQTDS